jgi:hypothetical protein
LVVLPRCSEGTIRSSRRRTSPRRHSSASWTRTRCSSSSIIRRAPTSSTREKQMKARRGGSEILCAFSSSSWNHHHGIIIIIVASSSSSSWNHQTIADLIKSWNHGIIDGRYAGTLLHASSRSRLGASTRASAPGFSATRSPRLVFQPEKRHFGFVDNLPY